MPRDTQEWYDANAENEDAGRWRPHLPSLVVFALSSGVTLGLLSYRAWGWFFGAAALTGVLLFRREKRLFRPRDSQLVADPRADPRLRGTWRDGVVHAVVFLTVIFSPGGQPGWAVAAFAAGVGEAVFWVRRESGPRG